MADRLERLVNLVACLLDAERPLTRADIVEKVPGYPPEPGEAQRRAFERDKESIREMGIPLETVEIPLTERDEAAGYVIRRSEYSLPELDLDADELAALHLAATAVRLEGVAGDEAVWKLGGSVGGAQVALADIPVTEHVTSLYDAIGKRSTVRFDYRGAPRTVDPWRLAFRGGRWHLTGFDHDRQDDRRFQVDRITSVPTLGPPGAFDKPQVEAAQFQPWLLGDDELVEARVWISAPQAAWAIDFAGPTATVERHDDGSVTLTLAVTSRIGLRSFVLGLLDDAELVSPNELRKEMVAWLEGVGG